MLASDHAPTNRAEEGMPLRTRRGDSFRPKPHTTSLKTGKYTARAMTKTALLEASHLT